MQQCPNNFTVIQPVIHKSIVKTEIRQITQPIYEEITQPVQVHENALPQDIKENLEKSNQYVSKNGGDEI